MVNRPVLGPDRHLRSASKVKINSDVVFHQHIENRIDRIVIIQTDRRPVCYSKVFSKDGPYPHMSNMQFSGSVHEMILDIGPCKG